MEIITTEINKKHYMRTKYSSWCMIEQRRGESDVTVIGDKCVHLEKGDICLVPPDYEFIHTAEEGSVTGLLLSNEFRSFGGLKVFKMRDRNESVAQIFDLIHFYRNDHSSAINYAVVKSLGDALFHMVSALYATGAISNVRIDRIIDTMHENVSNSNFDVKKCLESSGYSQSHLRKLFIKGTGMTPIKYMNQIRIERAKSQIQQFGALKNIKEIALECGFEDSLYFSRVFHQIEGMSPTEYREYTSERVINTMGINNCGGRCLLKAHVRNGEIVRFTTQTESSTERREALSNPPLTACVRGLTYHKTYLNPKNRLTKPLLRVGERGDGNFREISWKEAIEILVKEWIRIKETYGVDSRYVTYGWGVSGMLNPAALGKRLLALDGGYLEDYNNYSNPCIKAASKLTFGTVCSGSSMETLLQSKLIILWGHNPADTRFDTCMYYLRKAKEAGIPIICIDPRNNRTVKALSARWIGIRPGTDAALSDAMAYEIISAGKEDREFMDRYCQGFTADTMPEDAGEDADYSSYLFGKRDGVVKDAAWGEKITGIPAKTIRELAYLYADTKPAAIVQGYGPQRHINGEQNSRGPMMLACLTGNVGRIGGWSGATMSVENPPCAELPEVENPFSASIPVYRWTQAVEDEKSITAREGLKGIDRLHTGIKMILNLGGNCLINQHGDINHTREILRDRSLCEFIVTSDVFMTPSARYSDLVLPSLSFLETNNITGPWGAGNFIGFNNKVVEPLKGGRFEYDWMKDVARKLSIYNEFTQGRETAEEWLEWGFDNAMKQWRYLAQEKGMTFELSSGTTISGTTKDEELPSYNTVKHFGALRIINWPTQVAFSEMIQGKKLFETPSGKIEIFSTELADMERPDIPAIPGYINERELLGETDLEEKYPLQLVGYHTIRRCHTIHDNNVDMEALDPQAVYISAKDAKDRGINDGDQVRVFNHRGIMQLKVKVSEDIMTGVAAISQGAWYTPDKDGVDMRGNVNVFTSQQATPYAHGNGQHSIWVEIKRV